jgi:hypothetical protein
MATGRLCSSLDDFEKDWLFPHLGRFSTTTVAQRQSSDCGLFPLAPEVLNSFVEKQKPIGIQQRNLHPSPKTSSG